MILPALALALALGCTVDPTKDTSKDLVSLHISTAHHEDTVIEEGKTLPLFAISGYVDDTSKDVTTDPATVWASSDSKSATVDATGVVSALHAGAVKISASYKGQRAEEGITIKKAGAP
jgi:hypothetical protein